jgi:polyprenyldihydroxybenzoate methyltransferase/3-demethylubiquinol 3-O-methyltransferase
MTFFDHLSKFQTNFSRVPLIRDGLATTGVVKEEYKNTSLVLKDLNILEVGCGGGILTEALARIQANMTAIDPGDRLIDVAKEHLSTDPKISGRVQYLAETVEAHSIRNQEKYDAVIASEVLEHVKDKVSFLEHCVMALKPGGSLFLTTLNKTTISWLGGIVAAEYILRLLPRNTHDWDKFISPLEVERILASFNCSPVLVHGMAYDPLRNQWCWTKFTEVNYAMHVVKTCAEVKDAEEKKD